MRFQRIIQAVFHQPWLIMPSGHAAIARLVQSRLQGVRAEEFIIMGEEEIPSMRIQDGIAEIPIVGTIGKGLSSIEKSCGAVGTEDIQANLDAALANSQVRGIFLNIDSPGGTVSGVPELSKAISRATEQKPIVAYTDGLAASAAYWIASGATEVYASEASELGSIGVYIPWEDQTRAYENEGIKVELIKNKEGEFKGMGYPGTALTESQRAEMQRQVDKIFGMFSGFVRGNRIGIPDEAMKGQTFFGDEAVSRKLTDGVLSRSEAMQRLQEMTRKKKPGY